MTERKPWCGRFHQATDPTVERFSASIHVDCELAFYDIQGSKAHASMLGHVGILSLEDVEALHSGLDAIATEIEDDGTPIADNTTLESDSPDRTRRWSATAVAVEPDKSTVKGRAIKNAGTIDDGVVDRVLVVGTYV